MIIANIWVHAGRVRLYLARADRFLAWRFVAISCALGIVMVACSAGSSSASSDGGAAAVQLKDALGRTCNIADSDTGHLACDQSPQPVPACKDGAMPFFGLGVTSGPTGPAAVCAGCYVGKVNSFGGAENCSLILCATAAECPTKYPRCVAQQCRS